MSTFKCEMCNVVYEKPNIPEVLLVAEVECNFGKMPEPEDRAIVCDDCYNVFMRWFNKERPDLKDKSNGN